MSVKLIEIVGLRSLYGNDENAINRHSTRCYAIHIDGKDCGWGLHLDRVLDQLPIGFVATEFGYDASKGISKDSQPFPTVIKCPAIESCTTWGQIEKRLADVIRCVNDTPLSENETVELTRSDNELDQFHMYGQVYAKCL